MPRVTGSSAFADDDNHGWMSVAVGIISFLVSDCLKPCDQIFRCGINLLEDRLYFLAGDRAIDLKGASSRIFEEFRIDHRGVESLPQRLRAIDRNTGWDCCG